MHLSAFLLVLFARLDAVLTLTCYVCDAKNITICQRGNPHLREVHCGLEDTTFFWFCLYKVMKDSVTDEHRYSYSCERMGRPGIFTRLPHCNPQEHEEVVDCRVCLTDLCRFPDKASTCLRGNVSLILAILLFNLSLFFK